MGKGLGKEEGENGQIARRMLMGSNKGEISEEET